MILRTVCCCNRKTHIPFYAVISNSDHIYRSKLSLVSNNFRNKLNDRQCLFYNKNDNVDRKTAAPFVLWCCAAVQRECHWGWIGKCAQRCFFFCCYRLDYSQMKLLWIIQNVSNVKNNIMYIDNRVPSFLININFFKN